MAFGIIEAEGNMYGGLCITLNPPPSSSVSPLVAGYRWLARWHGILLSKKQEPAICPRLCEKLFFPVRQADVCARKLLLHRRTRLLPCRQRLLSSSADIWDGDWAWNERTERDVCFFFSSPISVNLLINMGRTKVFKTATTEIKVLCLTASCSFFFFFFCCCFHLGETKRGPIWKNYSDLDINNAPPVVKQ